MRRVLIYGNSHTIALRDGWKLFRAAHSGTDIEADFFALWARMPHLLAPDTDDILRIDPDRATPQDDIEAANALAERLNGRRSYPLSDTDAIVHVGGVTHMQSVTRLIGRFDILGLHSTEDERPAMGRATFEALLDSLVSDCEPAAAWATASARPLFFLPPPYLSARILWGAGDPDLSKHLSHALESGDEVGATLAAFEAKVRACVEARGFTWLSQPPETVRRRFFTRAAYGQKLGREKAARVGMARDPYHANAEYGALCWTMIAEALQKAKGGIAA